MVLSESVLPRPRRLRTPPQRTRRWRFPAGTVHLVGGGLRWERTEDEGWGGLTLLSGPLEISDGIGFLGAADVELTLATSLDDDAYRSLPEFRLCHLFYDTDLAGRGGEFGPWFCLCGCRGPSRGRLSPFCSHAVPMVSIPSVRPY